MSDSDSDDSKKMSPQLQYYYDNIETVKQRKREYEINNRAKINQRKNEYYHANREKIRQYQNMRYQSKKQQDAGNKSVIEMMVQ